MKFGSERFILCLSISLFTLLAACSGTPEKPQQKSFTIAVIPDTQNYIDYTRQTAEGFPLDAADIFIDQMSHIAGKAPPNGGDLAFVASVGDVWQHVLRDEDQEYTALGIAPVYRPDWFEGYIKPEETLGIEVPKAIEGYQLISQAGVPFGVAPGNHDYDAIWVSMRAGIELPEEGRPPDRDIGLHIAGFDAFRIAFGEDTDFFRDKDWYVGAHNGGSSSAQLFEAGGYQFLHLAFEMHAGDQVLEWAQSMLDQYSGLPTIISTHDFLNPQGERLPSMYMNLAMTAPDLHNTAEQIWQKFISQNDQIFLVLSGHHLGQATRIDENAFGHQVYQLLSDYQARGQAGLDAGVERSANGGVVGLGDGWYREMTFHLEGTNPYVEVRTYSSHYRTYSSALDTYAQWYKAGEQPEMTDAEFYLADEFTLELEDFYERFER